MYHYTPLETLKAVRDGLEHLEKKELIKGSMLSIRFAFDPDDTLYDEYHKKRVDLKSELPADEYKAAAMALRHEYYNPGVCAMGAGGLCAVYPDGAEDLWPIYESSEQQTHLSNVAAGAVPFKDSNGRECVFDGDTVGLIIQNNDGYQGTDADRWAFMHRYLTNRINKLEKETV